MNLLFHSGATEGIMTFAHSFSEWARLSGKDLLICFAKTDHPAVTTLSEHFFGAHVKFLELKINTDLSYNHTENLKSIQDKKDNNPNLIILYHHLWVHNETGIVSKLEDLIPLKSIEDLYLHVDAVQAVGKIADWQNLIVGDIFTFSPHKFGAMKGIGFSFYIKNISFHSLFSGGGQQQGQRGGTENPLAIKSISLALNDLKKHNLQDITHKRQELEKLLTEELNGLGSVITSSHQVRCSNTIYFYFDRLTSDVAVALFDLGGICISAGSACSSGAAKPSVILSQMNLKEVAKNGLRLSLPFGLTEESYEAIQVKIRKIFQQLRQRS